LANNREIGIGLMGLGVVGTEVARTLLEKEHSISSKLGCTVRIKRILVRAPEKERRYVPADVVLTDGAEGLIDDPAIDIIVEVMGGEYPALEYVQRALRAGKHVVTANKEMMAKHGPEILTLAHEHSVSIRFEAGVGGGIPIIGPLLKDLLANDIYGISAIINGTTNYVLTKMGMEGLEFNDAVRQAQALGYAEADPAADVEGLDAAYKLAILASLAFHTKIHASDVYYEGITKLGPADFKYAAELGYAIKLLAIGRMEGTSIQVRVHPTLVPVEHPLASVCGVFNAVELEGDLVGQVMFSGQGAGGQPTASAVVGDVLDIARNIVSGSNPPAPLLLDGACTIQPMADLETQYYIRLLAVDEPGVMAQITTVLGDLKVSLASVIQKEIVQPEGFSEIVITTHTAKESAVQEAVQRMRSLGSVQEVSNLVRMLDGEG
jgi:homoserine dehydrogenase